MNEQRSEEVVLVKMICPDCCAEFETTTPGPDEVCPTCWELFNGMTIEELIGE